MLFGRRSQSDTLLIAASSTPYDISSIIKYIEGTQKSPFLAGFDAEVCCLVGLRSTERRCTNPLLSVPIVRWRWHRHTLIDRTNDIDVMCIRSQYGR